MKELGRTSLADFDIEEQTGSHAVRCKPYRLLLKERAAVEEIVKSMLDAGMIERSRFEYASPVLLVKKTGVFDLSLTLVS